MVPIASYPSMHSISNFRYIPSCSTNILRTFSLFEFWSIAMATRLATTNHQSSGDVRRLQCLLYAVTTEANRPQSALFVYIHSSEPRVAVLSPTLSRTTSCSSLASLPRRRLSANNLSLDLIALLSNSLALASNKCFAEPLLKLSSSTDKSGFKFLANITHFMIAKRQKRLS